MAAPPPVPALVDDLVEEVLLRCPPDDPARLVRAALVCKAWCRLVSGPRFRRRFRGVHGAAPVLGLLYCGRVPLLFEPTASCSFRPRSLRPPYADWRALDARHGRVLISPFLLTPREESLAAWCPVTGALRTLPMPRFQYRRWTAALLCAASAAPGCGHLDCGGGPFLVVFVGADVSEQRTSVCVYSSEASSWSAVQQVVGACCVSKRPSALVENAVYFMLERNQGILKHELVTRQVSVIKLPPARFEWYTVLTAAEEGGLGLATAVGFRLLLWSRETAGSDSDAGWVQSRVIDLKALLPAEALLISPQVVGFAEGVGAVLLRTSGGFYFTVDVKSSCATKIGKGLSHYYAVPFVYFCTPVLRTASSGTGPRADTSTASQSEGAHVLASRALGHEEIGH